MLDKKKYDENFKTYKITDDMNVKNILIGMNLVVSFLIILYLHVYNGIDESYDERIKEISIRVDEINNVIKHSNDTISVVVNVYNTKEQ